MRSLAVALLTVVSTVGCTSFVEVPVETPLQSKLDVTRFRRILIAGFVTDLRDADVDLSAETSRLLQNQLRSNTRIQVSLTPTGWQHLEQLRQHVYNPSWQEVELIDLLQALLLVGE